jgi:hypothetical protein
LFSVFGRNANYGIYLSSSIVVWAFLSPAEVADDSNQKILVLVLWQGRLQAEHVDTVRKIMVSYYRKRSLPG